MTGVNWNKIYKAAKIAAQAQVEVKLIEAETEADAEKMCACRVCQMS